MSERVIGQSIGEAIDWTQDKLRTTRPIAETILFALLDKKLARETDLGFVLFENDDDDEERRTSGMRKLSHRISGRHFGRARFNMTYKRKSFDERSETLASRFLNPEARRLYALGHTSEGEELEHPDGLNRNERRSITAIEAILGPVITTKESE
jgi:hypothetical protein